MLDLDRRRSVALELERYLLETFARGQVSRFVDLDRGGYHEELDASGRPTAYRRKRLLVTCRQLYVMSHAAFRARQSGRASLVDELSSAAHRGFSYLCERFWDADHGGWFFSLTPEGWPLDPSKDLYAHAFVIFAASHYYRLTGEAQALSIAEHTWEMLDTYLRDHGRSGFFEAAEASWVSLRDGRSRRQNPHMHLLESCLAGARYLESSTLRRAARELRPLLEELWLDSATSTLREFFLGDWSLHPTHGEIVEPGHHYEWHWILHEYARLFADDSATHVGIRLADWADQNGRDDDGLVFDEVNAQGEVLTGSKRVWPQLEAIKSAAARVTQAGSDETPAHLDRLERRLDRAFRDYLKLNGDWTEQRDRGGKILRPELPGSTGYHIVFALSEAIDAIDPR